jgi:hypothetical protein
MMIPSLVAQAAPARDPGSAPAEGFEQAMAAALGIVPPQAPAPLATGDAAQFALVPGLQAVITTGTPTVESGTPLMEPSPAQPVSGLSGVEVWNPVSGFGGSSTGGVAVVGSDPQRAGIADTPLPGSPTGVEPGVAAGDEAVSGIEPPLTPVGDTWVSSGNGMPPTTVMAAASTAVIEPNRASAVAPHPERSAIAAQGLGLRSLRGSAPETDVATGPITDPSAADSAASAVSTGDVPPIAPINPDRRIDHSGAMPEPPAPGSVVATEAGPTVGVERPTRPEEPARQPAQPQAPGLDAVAGGVDQVTAQPTLSSGEVPGGSHVPSGMLQRIEDAVRRLENAPPPRSITLTIDDQGLTRVTVSMLTDGVRLTVPEGSQAPSGLVQDLEQALSNRGFELSRDGQQQQRHRPDDDDVPLGASPAPSAHPRRTTADTGVRL